MNLENIQFSFPPSQYQYDFFQWVVEETGNAVLKARAGSAKTSTIIEVLKLIPSNKSVLYIAFNRHISNDIKKKVKQQNVTVKTFHGLGYSALQNMRPNIILEDKKSFKLLIPELNLPIPDRSIYIRFIMRLLSCGKNAGIGKITPDDFNSWDELIDHFELDIDSKQLDQEILDIQKQAQLDKLPIPNYSELADTKAIQLTQKLLEISNDVFKKRGIIDFDDMIYLPLLYNLRFDPYDYIMVDESQDTNIVQQEIIAKLLEANLSSRLIAVGDEKQAIYQFRGADENAIPNIIKRFNCKILPLTISYRCPKTVIEAAKRIVPDIEAWEKAEQGSVEVLKQFKAEMFKPGDIILCRNNAPLLDMFYWLVKHNLGATIIGRDIAAGLVNLIRKIPTDNLDYLQMLLKEFVEKETKRLIEKGKEEKAARLGEKIDCINFIISNSPTVKTVSDLTRTIESMFSDEPGENITLSTIHKCKGLEFDNVYILNKYLFNGKFTTHDWQKQAEANLHYVAITRAKKHLYYIDSKDKLLDAKETV